MWRRCRCSIWRSTRRSEPLGRDAEAGARQRDAGARGARATRCRTRASPGPTPDGFTASIPGSRPSGRDGAPTWEKVGTTGREPQALAVADGRAGRAALLDGSVHESRDGGKTWTQRLPAG